MYTFHGKIRYSETDSEGRLTLPSLLNYFQDCTTFQSEELDIGIKYMKEQHLVWVLSFWQIEVLRYPRLGERVIAGTLPYEFKSFLGYRNFVLKTEEGECLAKAASLWSMLSTDTGKPTLPAAKILDSYTLEERIDMEYAPRKIKLPDGGRNEKPLVVKKQHLDTNHHVNNVQYINMAMEYLPEGFSVLKMRAEYKKQAFAEDVFYPYTAKTDGGWVIALLDEQGSPYAVAEFLGKELKENEC